MYIGDFIAGDVVHVKFTTVNTSGVPTALASGAISVYKDNSVTQSTAGITLTASFDSVTGLNHILIDTSQDGTFYSAGSDFQIVITTGTVDSNSVVGYVPAHFSINNRIFRNDTQAILGLKQLVINNTDAGDGISVTASNGDGASFQGGTNGHGIHALGNGSGSGIKGIGGASGHGLSAAKGGAPGNDIDGEIAALSVDTYAEPSQGAPAATATLAQKINYLYKFLRNKITSTDSQISVYNDAGDTVDHKASHSDDGTTYQRDEFISGP